MVSFCVGILSTAAFLIKMVRMRQMMGVSIWQQLVQGCLFCRCKFLSSKALI